MFVKRMRPPILFLVLLVIISLACSSEVTVYQTPSYPSAGTLVAETLAVLAQNAPTATATFPPTMTAMAASATPQEFGEVYVYTVVENVNLRTNPGLLFQVSRVMPQNTRLQLKGQSPGGEWLKVVNDEGVEGWVNVNVVKGGFDGSPPPVIVPDNVLLVTGSVVTESGTLVSGIGFNVNQGTRSTVASTDEDGVFRAYLPPTMSGTWTVEYVSISCTSNTMDANCNCINNRCGTADPARAEIQLPQKSALRFVWK